MTLNSAVVIPNLSLGLSLSSPYLAPELLDSFMRRMLISRISRRVLAEHHLALSDSYNGKVEESSTTEQHVGIIYTGLNVKQSIDKCTKLLKERSHHTDENYGVPSTHWPDVIVEGHLDTNFAYIKEHVEFVAIKHFLVPQTKALSLLQIHILRALEKCSYLSLFLHHAILCRVAFRPCWQLFRNITMLPHSRRFMPLS
jgi:hypothetical protein